MKKLLFLFIVVLSARQINAQTYVLIPDANFCSYLQGIIPSAMSGNSLNITSTLVTTATQSISVAYGISNLTGIQYFSSLISLACVSNAFLASLPPLPNSLQFLCCNNNSLTSLPLLPISLQTLQCNYNHLTTLPSLPNSITYIDCHVNSLTGLPVLPNSLQSIDCSQNHLSNLPTLPNSLQTLNCSYNYITTLPALPNSLQALTCNNNSITILPTLSNSLQALFCHHNNIACFPTFPSSITSISITPNLLTCLPNYLPVMAPSLLAYPICTMGNTNGCTVAAGIKELNAYNNEVSVFPNPNSGSFKVQIDNEIQNGEIRIENALGQQIQTQTVSKGINEITIKGIAKSLYYYSILENKHIVKTGKMAVE